MAAWWLASLVFPILCAIRSGTDEGGGESWSAWWLVAGIASGLLFANLIAVFLVILQHATLGHIDDLAQSGLLPFEDRVLPVARNLVGPRGLGGLSWFEWYRRATVWLFGTPGQGFSGLLRGPGYTDPATGVLLPGYPQMAFVAVVSLAWYLTRYAIDLRDTRWALGYPTGFYPLVAVFVIGWLLAGLGFWLDRYRVPTLLFVAAWLFCVYGASDDHNFDLNHRGAGHPGYFLPESLPEPDEDFGSGKNVYLAALAQRNPQQKDGLPQLYIADVLESGAWRFPKGQDGSRTLVVVAASGGGIQSAAWTTKVLTQLDRELPGFSQSVFLVSGVSGEAWARCTTSATEESGIRRWRRANP